MVNLLYVLYQSAFSFLALFLISKILGKKQVAQLEFTDYVVGISIGSIAAQMAVEPEIPFYHFLVAMAIYGVFDYLISIVSRKAKILKRLFKGRPLIIINQGEIDYEMLKKSKLDVNELLSACRAKSYFSLDEISYCLFEPSGDFSILPKQEADDSQQELSKPEEIPYNLVIDGKVNKTALKESGKNIDWLLKKAQSNNLKELKNIFLLSYLKKNNKVSIFHKYNKKERS